MSKATKKTKPRGHNGHSSPNQDKMSNPCKKSKTDIKNSNEPQSMETSPAIASGEGSLDLVHNLITVEMDQLPAEVSVYSRLDFIKSQRNNRYSPLNAPPFVVHIESLNSDENLGNIHPMKGKYLAKNFSFISNVRKIGKVIIAISFKYRHEVNSFVENDSSLLDNWTGYIPNYKVYRTGIVRGGGYRP